MSTDRDPAPLPPGPESDDEWVGNWPTSRPAALADELRWVHDMLRKDMGTVQRLATRLSAGATTAALASEVRDLATNGPIFRLRTNCLTFCQTLNSHHHGEDAALFPAVRRAAPQLATTLDRLERDHRMVAALVADIEGLVDGLDDLRSRQALAAALDALAETLLEHLDVEEQTLQPVLESWQTWPGRP